MRAEIRTELSKEANQGSGGGDFHVPFWADVKRFVAGDADLNAQSQSRVTKNRTRARLYPQLTDGFLQWWNEKRRWSNEPHQIISERIHGLYLVPQFNCTVKIENVLAIKVGETSHRIIYPYFPEDPRLVPEAARLGLWVLGQSLKPYSLAEMRILDVLRGTSYAAIDIAISGDEENTLVSKYGELLHIYASLRKEYE